MSFDEPIIVTEYNPSWPALFATERSRVRNACGDTVTRIEHFGSTAVPGMAAKPMVDILVGVRSLDSFTQHVTRLEAIGYQNLGPVLMAQSWSLRRRGPPHFDISITVDGGEFWSTQIRMREFLRSNPDEAAAYSHHKREIFAAGTRTLLSYSKAKMAFMTALIERATEKRVAGSG